ncbi:dienelactone hydrolase family protein [Herbaspirillum seropedicae]|nr:dienelactone hydrolase family protein [Herbaspirillum sp. alder98]MCA1323383.1 dienelactone hydrolase family protein [Herbaspirillum sp. alder98]
MLFLIGIGILAGCASDPRQQADALGQQAGLVREQIAAPPFVLTTYVRISRHDQPLTVYIEGDGLAWRSRYQPSDDPTPRQALGLRLAAADHSANVVYLARPCQFTAITDDPRCSVAYWTGKRFAPEVVTAMDAAVSRYAARVPGQPVNLVGYSGGGAIAVLVAARRQDIATLRTVAGNLDHDAVNRWHRVTPMPDSLNPIDVVDRVASIAQVHFSGADDSVVPTAIARSFVARAGPCATLRIVAGLSHEGDWASQWPQMLAFQPACHSASKK